MLDIVTPKEVIRIAIPYKFAVTNPKTRIYYKDYKFEEPFIINPIKIKEVTKKTSTSMFLLPFAGTYYWSPMFDELYREATIFTKVKTNFTIKISKTNSPVPILRFKINGVQYHTKEVKEIRPKRITNQ